MKRFPSVVADWEAKERQAQAEKEEAEFNRRRDAEVKEKCLFLLLTLIVYLPLVYTRLVPLVYKSVQS